jgi:AbrB family looped-hinge helix DNA binding protein
MSVTVSPRYQIVIPKEVREAIRLHPGQKFHVFRFGDGIGLVPVRAPQELRGMLKGIDTDVERDDDRV